MKLGTIVYDNKIYNLDYITSEDLKQIINMIEKNKIKDILKVKDKYKNVIDEVCLNAKLSRLYEYKVSNEIVSEKTNNQFNSMESSISQINSKFSEKSKNYDKVKSEMIETLRNYENVLKQYAYIFDEKIEDLIFKKNKLEYELVMANIYKEYLLKKENETQENSEKKGILKGLNIVADKIKSKIAKKDQVDERTINRLKDGQDIEKEMQENEMKSEECKNNEKVIMDLKKEIKKINQEIKKIEEDKENKLFEAMEVGGKFLSTQIKGPRRIKSITRFFINRFNTYKVIMKNVIEPVNQRIDEFKVNELGKVNGEIKEIDFSELDEKVVSIKSEVFDNIKNKMICEEIGIL